MTDLTPSAPTPSDGTPLDPTPPGPDLPRLRLERGPWRAELFDPRPDPLALGARYVQGGYVADLWVEGRRISGQASPAWDPYVGRGLPEVFEFPLAFHACAEGEEYLRIGAGRLVKTGPSFGAGGAPSTPVAWTVLEQGPTAIRMAAEDRVERAAAAYAYRLERTIRLDETGLTSHSRLTLEVPWNHPLTWFAHPFLAQTRGDATAFHLPTTRDGTGARAEDAAGLRLPPAGGLTNHLGLWGATGPIHCELDPALGGGRISIHLDRPLDHVVLYASPTAASPEPQWARAWKNGETDDWSLRYTATPG